MVGKVFSMGMRGNFGLAGWERLDSWVERMLPEPRWSPVCWSIISNCVSK